MKYRTEIGMSRSNLFRKLKSVTDQNPSEFIRTIRLKQAAVLLLSRENNITEVAYATGFNSSNYFTQCFREQFGKTPSEYIKDNV